MAVYMLYNLRSGFAIPERNLRERYPGYFRTAAEQSEFESLPRTIYNGSTFLNVSGYNYIHSSQGPPFISMVQNKDYHACCESSERYISPPYMVDVQNINRTMATFIDPVTGLIAKQYFYTETCIGKIGCRYSCTCNQRQYVVSGVYVMGPQIGVSLFPLLGSCKCRNWL